MYWIVLAMLVWAHYLADYPLQGEFLSKAKSPDTAIVGVPWWQALVAHSFIQGGFVFIIVTLGFIINSYLSVDGHSNMAEAVLLLTAMRMAMVCMILETIIHGVTDYMKSTKLIDFNVDQIIHVVCKMVWAGVATPVISLA